MNSAAHLLLALLLAASVVSTVSAARVEHEVSKKHHKHKHKKHQSPAPAPPSGNKCDENTTCKDDQTCCCAFSMSNKCFQYGCCPYPQATCCKDQVHCCPSSKPVCDLDKLRCTDGQFSIPMIGTVESTSRWGADSFFVGEKEATN